MISYKVRSISLLNLVSDIRNGRLIPDAYFQRNLVWRDKHKRDFIETILMGFPFPEIFISKGKVDVETMTTISCIVDGQQRTNAIMSFIKGELNVGGKVFQDLSEDAKSDFLKYEIAVIELDLENDDPKVKEIFTRINRNANSLTTIEKWASEFGASDFMLVAKLLIDQISLENNEDDLFSEDPNIPGEFYEWGRKQKTRKFVELITKKDIFSPREMAKKVHLMHVLNIMSTLKGGFFARNDSTISNLENCLLSVEEKEELVFLLEKTANIILNMKFHKKSYWYNKSNIFSLIVALANSIKDGKEVNEGQLRWELTNFEENTPPEYKLAATEGVNNHKERNTRNFYIEGMINKSLIQKAGGISNQIIIG